MTADDMIDAITFAQGQTLAQIAAFYLATGLWHIVEQRGGGADEADAWAAEHVAHRYERTPVFLTWIGFPLWGFADGDDALAFKMRFG